MNLGGMVGIMTIVFVVLLVASIIIARIDWQRFFERRYGNNPDRARIYIESDENVMSVPGELIYSGAEGMVYGYKWLDVHCVVCVPENYPFKFLHGRRMIRVRAGETTPRGWDETTLSPEGVFSVSALVRSHLVRELVLSMTGGGVSLGWLKWVLVIGVVVAVGYLIFTQMGGV